MVSIYPDKIESNEIFIEQLKNLKLKVIPLRVIDGKPLIESSLDVHQEVSKLLHANKIKVLYLDFGNNYVIDQTTDLDLFAELALIYKTRSILIPLFNTKLLKKDKDEAVNLINNLLKEAKKKKLDINFHLNYEIPSSYLAYFIKKVKGISFYFNPGECYLNKRSITSYYRLIRKNISIAGLSDIDEHYNPVLLGYGKGLILDTIDKLQRDRFRGFIVYDYNLVEYTKKREKAYKRFFVNPFKRKKRKAHLQMDQALNISDKDSLSVIDVIESQLNLIKRYKKLWFFKNWFSVWKYTI